MNRLEVLKKLETILEQFIAGVLKSETTRIAAHKSIDALDDIARDSLRGRRIHARLGNWLARSDIAHKKDRLTEPDISRIGNLFREIQSGLDRSDPEAEKLDNEIRRWRESGVVPKRKLVLKMQTPVPSINTAANFSELMKKESAYLADESERNPHLLSILDDALKSAAAKNDKMYLHLAGAIVYFLKINGYKVGPYAKRLREIEQARMGVEHVA